MLVSDMSVHIVFERHCLPTPLHRAREIVLQIVCLRDFPVLGRVLVSL